MIRIAEAVIDEHGTVRLLEPVEVAGVRRALVTSLDEEPTSLTHETAIVSERSLAEGWNRPEEHTAWSHLQRDRRKLENSTEKRLVESSPRLHE